MSYAPAIALKFFSVCESAPRSVQKTIDIALSFTQSSDETDN
jgi:hypothetical protein